MTREMIITELNNRGYNADSQNSIKNGVVLEGIRISTNSNIALIIYTEGIIENAEEQHKTLDDVVSAIIGVYESSKAVNLDVKMFFDRDYILNNIYIGMQKDSTEDIEKKACDLEGIESYLYIRGDADKDGYYSAKISRAILENANISESEAWEKAEEHINAETTITSMAKVMCAMMNMESNRQTSQKRRKVYCYFYDMEAHHKEKEIRIRGRTRKNVYDESVFLSRVPDRRNCKIKFIEGAADSSSL